jgi:hypothetical protein
MTKYTAEEVAESKELLRSWLKPGDTVTTIHQGFTQAGRKIEVAAIVHGEIWDITGHVARVIGARRLKDGSLFMGGGGMDLGFLVVYSLGRALFSAQEVEPEITRGAGLDHDGGYMLSHRWF